MSVNSNSSCDLSFQANFNEISLACKSISHKWEEFAKHLNIDRSTVLSIQTKRGQDTMKCLDELLEVWLCQSSSTQSEPASWRKLIDAILKINGPLSKEMWAVHTQKCSICHTAVDSVTISAHRNTPVANAVRRKDGAKAAQELRDLFDELLVFLLEEIKHKNADKLRLYLALAFKRAEELNDETDKHLIKIESIPAFATPASILNYFIRHDFIGYINYRLIEVFQKLAESSLLDKRINEYENDYQCFLELSITDIHSILQLPDNLRLHPTYPAGIPKFSLRLESNWHGKSMLSFKDFLKECFASNDSTNNFIDKLMIAEIERNCIIIAFAVLPHIAREVMKCLANNNVIMSMNKAGVSIDSISEQLKKYNEIILPKAIMPMIPVFLTSNEMGTADPENPLCSGQQCNSTSAQSRHDRSLQDSFYMNAVVEQGRGRPDSEQSQNHMQTDTCKSCTDEQAAGKQLSDSCNTSSMQQQNSSMPMTISKGMSFNSTSAALPLEQSYDKHREQLAGVPASSIPRLYSPESAVTRDHSSSKRYICETDDNLPNFKKVDQIIDYLFSTTKLVRVHPLLIQVSGLAKCGKTTTMVKALKLPDPHSQSRFLLHELVISGKKGFREGVKSLLRKPYESFRHGIKAGMPLDYSFAPAKIIPQELEASIKNKMPQADSELVNFVKETIIELHKPFLVSANSHQGKTIGHTNRPSAEQSSHNRERSCDDNSTFVAKSNKKNEEFENNLRNGIGLCNIWDIDVTETAIRSFIESFGFSFTQKHVLLFIDLERDAAKLVLPPEDLPAKRSRLQYLFRNCQMTSRDADSTNGEASKICHIFAKYTSRFSSKVKNQIEELKKECKNAARQMGVQDIIDFQIIEVEFTSMAGASPEPTVESKRRVKHILESIWKHKAQKKTWEIPLSWFLLIGWLSSRGDASFYIARNELRRIAYAHQFIKEDTGSHDSQQQAYDFEAFCKFFTSYGSIIDVAQVNDRTKCNYVITKPLNFFDCQKSLLNSEKISKTGVINKNTLTEEEEVVLDIMVSVGLATILPSRADRQACYYLPSFCRNLPKITNSNSEAIQLSLGISSPLSVDSLQIEILTELGRAVEVLLDEPKYSNVVIVRQEGHARAKISFTSHGTVLEIFTFSDDAKKLLSLSVLKSCSDMLVKAVKKIILRKSKDFNRIIKYQYALLCKRDDQVLNVAFNAYKRQHVLPTSQYCIKCKGGSSQYDKTLEAWNYTLNEPDNSIPEEHQDGELLPRTILEISKDIASSEHHDWESVKFLAERLNEKVSMVAPKKSCERQFHIMQMLMDWAHTASIQQDDSLRKVLARKLIECHEELSKKDENNAQAHVAKLPTIFKALARKVDMQVLTRAQRQEISALYAEESSNSRGHSDDDETDADSRSSGADDDQPLRFS